MPHLPFPRHFARGSLTVPLRSPVPCSMLNIQLEAQRKETQQAVDTLNEAAREMEAIHFEKKQLAQQWRSTLVAISKRDEALAATAEAISRQREQELALTQEIAGVKKDIVKEQQRNEQLSGLLGKVQAEAAYLTKQIRALQAKQEAVKAQYAHLSRALEDLQGELGKEEQEGRRLEAEVSRLDRQYVRVNNDIQALGQDLLARVSEQVTLEKSAQKAVEVTRGLQERVRQEELGAIALQNELAKVEIDVLNTQSHNDQLQKTLQLLDEELQEKARTIDKYQQEIRRR